MRILQRSAYRVALKCETLEDRTVPTTFHPTLKYAPHGSPLSPHNASSPYGLSPAQVRGAYGSNSVLFNGIVGDGAGQTIAIVDAYNNPTIVQDLIAFDNYYGLPHAPSFQVLNQTGGTIPNQTGSPTSPSPVNNVGWAGEIALDVEWAHAMAPGANIILFEASSASDTALYQAVDTARNWPGVVAVSMSFGSDEASSDTANDYHFTTPAGHVGVTFFASSGDSGSYGGTYPTHLVGSPAASPNVVSVGGTFLSVGTGNTYGSETGWGNGVSTLGTSGTSPTNGSFYYGGGGGGISTVWSQPSYQSASGLVAQSQTKRTVPDVAFLADPASGASTYSVYANGSSTPWSAVGGTSLAAPMWAGVMAVIDQGRTVYGGSSLDGATQTLPKLYSLPAANFRDVTGGNNGGYSAAAGYDLVTGRGTPVVNLLAQSMAASAIGSFGASPSPAAVGTAVTLTAANVAVPNGTISTVQFYRESNGTAGFQAGDTLLGTGTQSGTTWTYGLAAGTLAAGSYTLYAVATDGTGAASVAAAALTVTPLAATGTLAGWDVSGQTAFGTTNLAAAKTAPGVTSALGLTRGSGVTTTTSPTPSPAPAGWGGRNWQSTSTAGLSGNDFITFGLTVGAGKVASLSSITLNYLRNVSTSPTNGLWQYQLNNGTWTTFADVANEFTVTDTSARASVATAMTPLGLSNVAALQNIAAGTAVNFRLVPYGGTSTTSGFYILNANGSTNLYDLAVTGTVGQASTVTVTSSAGPAAFGDTLSFYAAVVPTGTAVVPTGTVTYTIDGVAQTPVGLVAGSPAQATLTTGSLSVGTHTIVAKYNGDANFAARTSANFTQVINAPTPTALAVLVNGTTAPAAGVTASRVTSLTLDFNTPVTVADGAFTLSTPGTAATLTNGAGGGITVTGGGTTHLTLTFTNVAGLVDFASLADGIWALAIDPAKVTNATGNAMAGAFSQPNIRRLFGDVNGDGDVDANEDLEGFLNAFGTVSTDAGYTAALDFDGNGSIDPNLDLEAFLNRFGATL